MKSYIRTILLLLLTLCISNIKAQISLTSYKAKMDVIFAKVDHSKVTTGLLSDYGLQLIPPNYYNGTLQDSNEVDVSIFQKLYAGMDYSRFNSISTLPTQSAVNSAIVTNQPTTGQVVPITMMNISYNTLRSDANTAGLVTISNNQIYDVAGKNPYSLNTLFAACPITTCLTSSSVQFIFKTSLYFTNSSKTISSIIIDAGDGSGFRSVSWNTAFTVNYSSSGNKLFVIKVTCSDGTTMQTHGKINITYNSTLKAANGYDYYTYNYNPCNSDSPNPNPFVANLYHSGGTVTVRYGNASAGDRKIRKPFIIAEGYDAWKIMTIPNTTIDDFLDKKNIVNYYGYKNVFGTVNIPISTSVTLRDYLYTQGYDIIYLDYNKGTDDIIRNATLLEDVIKWVNTTKIGSEPNVVMGISMGGLVARYALRDMEIKGIDHQTKIYFSLDSPHNGANVPIGAQAAIIEAQGINALLGLSDDITKAYTLFNEPATKQMLIYNIAKSNGSLGINNSTHDSFMNLINGMGFPQKCYNVALSDGSGTGNKYFEPGTTLINYTISSTLNWWQNLLTTYISMMDMGTRVGRINVCPGKSEIIAECTINGITTTASKVYSARVYVNKKLLWCIPVVGDIVNTSYTTPSGLLPIDGAPGGCYDVTQFVTLPTQLANAIKKSSFSFIPATSALAISNWQGYLTEPLNNTNFVNTAQTNFQEYYMPMPSNNNLHTSLYTTDNSMANFIKKILDNTNSYCTESSTIQNKDYTTSQTINKCILYMNNVNVKNNSIVTFDASKLIEISGPFHTELGSTVHLK